MNRRLIAPIVGFAILMGCSSDKTPSGTDGLASGSLSFNHSSTLASGSYSAQGAFPASNVDPDTREWAFGFRDAQANTFAVVANKPKTGARFDFAVIGINRLTTGSMSIEPDCDPEADICTGVAVFFNFSDDENATGQVFCALESGTVAITSISTSRATGTFTGTGFCFNFDDEFVEAPLSITGGTFDVAVVSDIPTSLSVR